VSVNAPCAVLVLPSMEKNESDGPVESE